MIKFDKVVVLKRLEDNKMLKFPAVMLEKSIMLQLRKPTSKDIAPYLFINNDLKSGEKLKLETIIEETDQQGNIKVYEASLEYIFVGIYTEEEFKKMEEEKKKAKEEKKKAKGEKEAKGENEGK